MFKGKNLQTINVLFNILLLLVFVISAFFAVLIGGKVYENISSRMESDYVENVPLSYIANKVRQGNENNNIDVVEIDGIQVLTIKQEIDGDNYITEIYYKDGYIRELFTDEESGLSLEDGLEIIKCSGLNIEKKEHKIYVETKGDHNYKLILSLRNDRT